MNKLNIFKKLVAVPCIRQLKKKIHVLWFIKQKRTVVVCVLCQWHGPPPRIKFGVFSVRFDICFDIAIY
jgi:hypothetical protein